MRTRLLAAVAAGAAIVALLAASADAGRFTLQGSVTSVTDGDTLVVRLSNGRSERVRLIGIDAPERGACWSSQSSAAATRLASGERVTLRGDATQDTRDRYGRLLAYVYVGDTFVNAELVRRGYAQPLTVPPNVRHAERFSRLARDARRAGSGLWASCSS